MSYIYSSMPVLVLHRSFPAELTRIEGRNYLNVFSGDFPGGPEVKNLPANSRDTGLTPGPGRSHMLRGYLARSPRAQSLCSAKREATTRRSPHTSTRESPLAARKPQHRQK